MKHFLRSVRFKIVLWYMVLLWGTLALFSGLVYARFHRELLEGMDDVLGSRAEGVSDSIDTYWETEKNEAGVRVGFETFLKANNVNFAKIATHWVEEKSGDPELLDIAVRIFDAKGRPIVFSKNLSVAAGSFKGCDGVLRTLRPSRDTVRLAADKGRLTSWRVLTLPVLEEGRLAYIVQIASPLHQLNRALTRLRIILFVFLPLTVFVTGIIGASLARVALRPIDDMVFAIRRISEDNLKTRVEVLPTHDEVERLARTFNEMLAKLEGAFASQKRFIQDASHELKTPLTIVKGELEVALKRPRTPDEYREVLKSDLEEVDRLIRLIEDLLVLARLDASSGVLRRLKVDAASWVGSVVRDIRPLAEAKGIAIGQELASGVTLGGDEASLRRALLNLLDNAIKYTGENGRVEVSVKAGAEEAVVTVADTGIGIPPDDLPRIFDRFFRSERSPQRPGAGLGLSIAHAIITAHGGRIEVTSEPGRGTTFFVFLPRVH